MSESKALSPIAEADYEAIEAAVMETHRGRWFLAEYARRNRTADTTMLLEAIARLENAVARERETERMDRLRFDLVEMARAITSTKREIASIRPSEGAPSDLVVASEALDGIVATTERATSDILEAAEHVQEAAWTLREDGAREDLCDELDRRATDIYTSCSFQDLTAQRTKRIIETLRFLEGRINAMIDVWGGSLDEEEDGERSEERETLSRKLDVFSGLDQQEIDDVIVEAEAAGPVAASFATPTVIEPAIESRPAPVEAVADEIAWQEADDAAFVEIEAQADDAQLDDAVLDDAVLDDAVLDDGEMDQTEAADDVVEMAGEIDLGAFAEIDALSTREKLARFS
jgi:chemotaxis regulatin CheY-phosphate phosphatase CheZ